MTTRLLKLWQQRTTKEFTQCVVLCFALLSMREVKLEKVTGKTFEKPAYDSPVRARIEENLKRAFPEYFTG